MTANTQSSADQGTKSKNKKKKQNAAKQKAGNESEPQAVISEESLEGKEGGRGEEPSQSDQPPSPRLNGVSEKSQSGPDGREADDKDGSNGNRDYEIREPEGHDKQPEVDNGSTHKLDELVRERDSLRVEVTEMRKSLEEMQLKHQEDLESLRSSLKESETKKEHAENQFQKLLERVNTIKSQLGERLKEDAEELSQARARIEELETENTEVNNKLSVKDSKLEELIKETESQSKELSSLRNRTNLSQQNWLKEKEELLEQEAYLRSEFEEAKQAMHNWEVLAMEERSIREGLGVKVIDLEEQLASLQEAFDKSNAECENQSVTIDGLQRALQEIQIARKQELRDLVQSSDAQLENLKASLHDAEKKASASESALQTVQKELERLAPFEKEVKEKNLLIGKLRHEAVTLNDHLTKALRFLKKGKPEDNVDRHIVTNHLLHFLALDRSDPKKFQILQLIAALLKWTDDQREQAGLTRPGTSNTTGSLRAPSFSLHRTPSTPSLATEVFDNGTPTGKETLAELWSNFLEQEAQVGKDGTHHNAKSP